jgi:hypothetical protein
MAKKPNKTGRDPRDHGTYMRRELMAEPAFRAMSAKAQVLYFWLKLEWKGSHYNNNGKIRLSLRQAATRLGIGINAAGIAFRELQAKGFIVVTQMGALGVEGEARGPSYEITEISLPTDEKPVPRMLYRQWREGQDFPVAHHNANNPTGRNGRRIPSSNRRQTHHENGDVSEMPVIKSGKAHHQSGDVSTNLYGSTVIKMKTSLFARPSVVGQLPDLSVTAGLGLCPLLSRASG